MISIKCYVSVFAKKCQENVCDNKNDEKWNFEYIYIFKLKFLKSFLKSFIWLNIFQNRKLDYIRPVNSFFQK